MAWAWHGKCESDTAALCKQTGKDTFSTPSGTAWQGNGMGTACYVCESALRFPPTKFRLHSTHSVRIFPHVTNLTALGYLHKSPHFL